MKQTINQNKNLLLTISKEELVDKLIELDEKFEQKIKEFEKIIGQKDTMIRKLQEELKKQKNRLNRNSKNSSQPPSTDQYEKKCKPKSEREKSGKKSGGQLGHKGLTLQAFEKADIVQEHDIKQCHTCDYDLSTVQASEYIRRQEIDIPTVKPTVVEHRMAAKTCPECKTKNVAKAPEGLTQSVQYGPRINAFSAYLHYEQFIPLKRIQDMCSDIFSLKISQGSLVNMHEKMHDQLESSASNIQAQLLKEDVVHFDETSMYINGKTQWLHSASTGIRTVYSIHAKRGCQAMDAMNILPQYQGTAVHDHWKPYFTYSMVQHALCNAHHIRELQGIFENYEQPWAQQMRELLLSLLRVVNEYKNAGGIALPADIIEDWSEKYDAMLQVAHSQIPKIKLGKKKRGKIKQHPAQNLHDRLTKRKTETLRFMNDFSVPFTNNQAEQDVRMAKVKQKISGGFRSPEGADRFCRIRGYISTAKKQNINVFAGLVSAARGQPETFLS